ncbi:hypothetical protein ACFUCV_14305 [Specibacter sp. NPDC057265]|uniref:hypothetical protein n=1 Tax=Specibacter sp. NPDC057265 TaxID=3346075 RepID=UPI0036400D96
MAFICLGMVCGHLGHDRVDADLSGKAGIDVCDRAIADTLPGERDASYKPDVPHEGHRPERNSASGEGMRKLFVKFTLLNWSGIAEGTPTEEKKQNCVKQFYFISRKFDTENTKE